MLPKKTISGLIRIKVVCFLNVSAYCQLKNQLNSIASCERLQAAGKSDQVYLHNDDAWMGQICTKMNIMPVASAF